MEEIELPEALPIPYPLKNKKFIATKKSTRAVWLSLCRSLASSTRQATSRTALKVSNEPSSSTLPWAVRSLSTLVQNNFNSAVLQFLFAKTPNKYEAIFQSLFSAFNYLHRVKPSTAEEIYDFYQQQPLTTEKDLKLAIFLSQILLELKQTALFLKFINLANKTAAANEQYQHFRPEIQLIYAVHFFE